MPMKDPLEHAMMIPHSESNDLADAGFVI